MAPRIFISYSHKNTDFATKLTKDLEREGYDIWLDQTDIKGGSRWDDEIVKGLNASQAFVILLSKSSAVSQNVKDEIGYAIDQNMHIIPLLIEACEVPFRLRRNQYIDFTMLRYGEGLKAVLENLSTAFPGAELHPKKKERKLMDPAELAQTVTGLLVPLLAKMGESVATEVGAKLPDRIGKLWGAITNRFQGNPSAAGAASDLVQKADDPDNQEAFTLQLRKVLKGDEDFAHHLTDLLEEAKKESGISVVGNGVVANNDSIAVGKIHIGGNMDGNFTIGNQNQINRKKK